MPNYCDNTLEIHSVLGIYDDIISKLLFTEPKESSGGWGSPTLGGKAFSFEAALPTPEPLRGVSAPAKVVTKEELKEFLKLKKKGEMPWQGRPITQAMFNKYLKKYGCTDWYHWNIANWGVKWDADVYDINHRTYQNGDVEKVEIRIHFTTAWAPPTNWFDYMASVLARLGVYMELRYSESGMGFAGTHYFDEVDRWDAEGTIYMVQDSTDSRLKFDNNMGVWRNEKGHFVSEDDMREEYEYDSQAL
jgi:hypothetical protein